MKTLNTQKHVRRLALASALMAGGLVAVNGMAADDTADVSATVVVPITIVQVTDMAFGAFAAPVAGAGADAIVLATDGDISNAGGAVLIGGGAGAAVASFTIGGEATLTFDVEVVTTTQPTNGVETMTLTPQWDFTAGAGANPPTGTIGTDVTLLVGGSLAVAEEQDPGAYAGVITATVEYN